MNIVLYSNHCPKCEVLYKKLTQHKIAFNSVDDIETMLEKGIDFTPVLEIDGEMLNFADAVKFIENYTQKG